VTVSVARTGQKGSACARVVHRPGHYVELHRVRRWESSELAAAATRAYDVRPDVIRGGSYDDRNG